MTLREDCLSVEPKSAEEVQEIVDVVCFDSDPSRRHFLISTIRQLCLSHERLRHELLTACNEIERLKKSNDELSDTLAIARL